MSSDAEANAGPADWAISVGSTAVDRPLRPGDGRLVPVNLDRKQTQRRSGQHVGQLRRQSRFLLDQFRAFDVRDLAHVRPAQTTQ